MKENLGEGNGNPLQCSCLENLMDGEAWYAAVHGVAQSQTRLKWLSSSRIWWVDRPAARVFKIICEECARNRMWSLLPMKMVKMSFLCLVGSFLKVVSRTVAFLPEEFGILRRALLVWEYVFCFEYSPSDWYNSLFFAGIDPSFVGPEVYIILEALFMKHNVNLDTKISNWYVNLVSTSCVCA